jgi:hypothetical protein
MTAGTVYCAVFCSSLSQQKVAVVLYCMSSSVWLTPSQAILEKSILMVRRFVTMVSLFKYYVEHFPSCYVNLNYTIFRKLNPIPCERKDPVQLEPLDL